MHPAYKHQRLIRISHSTPHSGQVRENWYLAGCKDGRIGVASGHNEFEVASKVWAESYEFGWHWRSESATDVLSDYLKHYFGPLGWESFSWAEPGGSYVGAVASCPCWLLALLTGGWPFVVLVRLGWRRIEQSRDG